MNSALALATAVVPDTSISDQLPRDDVIQQRRRLRCFRLDHAGSCDRVFLYLDQQQGREGRTVPG